MLYLGLTLLAVFIVKVLVDGIARTINKEFVPSVLLQLIGIIGCWGSIFCLVWSGIAYLMG